MPLRRLLYPSNPAYAVAGAMIVLTITGSAFADTHAAYTKTFGRCVASVFVKGGEPADPRRAVLTERVTPADGAALIEHAKLAGRAAFASRH